VAWVVIMMESTETELQIPDAARVHSGSHVLGIDSFFGARRISKTKKNSSATKTEALQVFFFSRAGALSTQVYYSFIFRIKLTARREKGVPEAQFEYPAPEFPAQLVFNQFSRARTAFETRHLSGRWIGYCPDI
jgi:hypothetical protein